jgi:hypothetical protein
MTEDNVFALHEVGPACFCPRTRGAWLRAGFVAAWVYVAAFAVLFPEGHAPAWVEWGRLSALVSLGGITVAGFFVSRRLGLAFAGGLLLAVAVLRLLADGRTAQLWVEVRVVEQPGSARLCHDQVDAES